MGGQVITSIDSGTVIPRVLAAGDGSRRIGERLPVKRPYRARAAEAWQAALFLPRAQHSVDGVLRVAEGFGRLGDVKGLTQVLRIADGLVRRIPAARRADMYSKSGTV